MTSKILNGNLRFFLGPAGFPKPESERSFLQIAKTAVNFLLSISRLSVLTPPTALSILPQHLLLPQINEAEIVMTLRPSKTKTKAVFTTCNQMLQSFCCILH